MSSLQVLFEDNHLLVVNKPADMPTMGGLADRISLLGLAKEYLRVKYNKPGNVYLGVVSRLDLPVTGVLVFARTSKAAARLSAAFRDRRVEKRYWALVERSPTEKSGTLRHAIRKDESRRRMVVCRSDHPEGQQAELRFSLLGTVGQYGLLDVELLTGRKHQIRVQLEAIRSPILGDSRYGAQARFPQGIALHSQSLILDHPTHRTPLEIRAPLPSYWPQIELAAP